MIKEFYNVLIEIELKGNRYKNIPPRVQELKNLGYIELTQIVENGQYHDAWKLTEKAKEEIELYEKENHIEHKNEVYRFTETVESNEEPREEINQKNDVEHDERLDEEDDKKAIEERIKKLIEELNTKSNEEDGENHSKKDDWIPLDSTSKNTNEQPTKQPDNEKKEIKKKNFTKIAFVIVMIVIILVLPISLSLSDFEKNDCYTCKNGDLLDADYLYKKELSTTATCTKSGMATIQCPFCKRTAEIKSVALGHNFMLTKDEATCLQGGNTYYACTRKGCNMKKTEFSQASPTKHKWVKTYSRETVKYTYTDYQCSVCKETKTEKTTVYMGHTVKNTEEDFYYATAAAIRIVKTQLKYPSSARFLKESLMEVHYNYSSYFIEGAVSAPNSFGVYTDFYFIVKTKIKVTGSKFTWYDYDCILEEG